jgi:cytochrome c peroxidase
MAKIKIKTLSFIFIMLLIGINLLIFSCKKEALIQEHLNVPTPYTLTIPRFFPTIINNPSDNPMTVEGIQLGRYLFYDGRLRGYLGTNPDSLMSCGTCHLQENAFECGINHPKYTDGQPFGVTGIPTPHVMLPMQNLVFNNEGYFWNGLIYKTNPNSKRRSIEDVVEMGLTAPHEMYSTPERAVAAISSIAIYPSMFEAAFGTQEVTFDRIKKAIAQFVRTLVSSNSKFDQWLRGEENLSEDEMAGYILFTTEEGGDCFHCHGGGGNALMTTNLFYNNGKDTVFNDPRDRFAVTQNPSDHGAYRAPTLRNIALTGPYMHDGRYKTLDEVIEFYSSQLVSSPYVHPLMHKINQGGALLTPIEKAQLKAFLLALTDHDFITNPRFARPIDLP